MLWSVIDTRTDVPPCTHSSVHTRAHFAGQSGETCLLQQGPAPECLPKATTHRIFRRSPTDRCSGDARGREAPDRTRGSSANAGSQPPLT